MLYSAEDLCGHIAPKLKYVQLSLQLQFRSIVEWWYLPLAEWKGLLFPVFCGGWPITGGVRTSSYYSLYTGKNEQHLKMFVVSTIVTAHIDCLQSSLRTF